MREYDYTIIGGGIFGCYAALYLAERNQRVLLLEKENQLLTKASIVNQARLHSGYHYPRSIATARMSDENKLRFTEEHQKFINFSFDKYYGIDKHGSFTDRVQFQRFCEHLKIKCKQVTDHPYINFDRLEALFLTTEYSFDPILIAQYYRQRVLNCPGIEVELGIKVASANATKDGWQLYYQSKNGSAEKLMARQVINATYAGSNSINQIFRVRPLRLMHEISEMVFVTSPQIKNMGITVMDGQFGSLMPYGLSGLLSLSSVAYTHHKVSYDFLPNFDCQDINTACKPDYLSNCNYCPARPRSNQKKMLGQIRHYFNPSVTFYYYKSMFTIKSKLRANYIDDGRPTEIALLHENPNFYCIFAGKINSIYEIEKMVR